jgi:hypothetical protein
VALVSAGVGPLGALGGAAIGGVAAARGARLEAETTTRATANTPGASSGRSPSGSEYEQAAHDTMSGLLPS